MSNSKLVGALALGAAAGAAITLYLTSEKGSEFRQMIATKAGDLFSELKEKATEGKNMITNAADKFTTAAEGAAQNAAGEVISKVQSNMYV